MSVCYDMKFLTPIYVSVSPRKHHILFSTEYPPTVQRIAWPSEDESGSQDKATKTNQQRGGFDTWILNEEDFPWFIEPDGVCFEFVSTIVGFEGVGISISDRDTSFPRYGNRDMDHF